MHVENLDIATLSQAQRIGVICELLSEVVPGIRSAQAALDESDEPTNTMCIVAVALGRLGWIAEQCSVLAGSEFTPVVGGADAWLLGLSTRNALSDLIAGASAES